MSCSLFGRPSRRHPSFCCAARYTSNTPRRPASRSNKKKIAPATRVRAVKSRAADVNTRSTTQHNRQQSIHLNASICTARRAPLSTRRNDRGALDIYSCPAHVRVHDASLPRPSASASLGVNSTEICGYPPLDYHLVDYILRSNPPIGSGCFTCRSLSGTRVCC